MAGKDVYKCERCLKVMPAGTKAFRLAVEYRPRHYPARIKANQFNAYGKKCESNDPGGIGREIAREITICPACYKIALAAKP